MATTFTVGTLTNTDWVEITGGGKEGMFTNSGGNLILYREAQTKPDFEVKSGHGLNPNANIHYKISSSQQVFGRSLERTGQVTVTNV